MFSFSVPASDQYSNMGFIESGNSRIVLDKIRRGLVTSHTAFVYREWRGTPAELVNALAPAIPADTKPHSLTRRLNASTQTLTQQYGVQYQSRRTMDSREITLSPLTS